MLQPEKEVAMKTILVCYEERPVANRVLERTAELAKALRAKVIVTSVAPALGFAAHGIGPYDPADPPARHREEAEDAATRLAELGVTGVETASGLGDPGRTIVELADTRAVDLIVLGASDSGLLSRLFAGSVEDAVVHKAHTDVLVVH
jgi:nucleotide-binding universal stress UspA family protein